MLCCIVLNHMIYSFKKQTVLKSVKGECFAITHNNIELVIHEKNLTKITM